MLHTPSRNSPGHILHCAYGFTSYLFLHRRLGNERRCALSMRACEDRDAPEGQPHVVLPPEEDGTWSCAPAFKPLHKLAQSSDDHPPDSSALPPSPHLHELTRAELIARLAAAEESCARYANAARAILAALALSPAANAYYARIARTLLVDTLETLPSITSIRHCECSMPSIASGAEAPVLDLVRFDGLSYSEWDVLWSPRSWWLSVAVTTAVGLHVHVRVSNLKLQGRFRCSLPHDLSSVRIGFAGSPHIDLSIETEIGIGVVPVPFHESIESTVREGIANFFAGNLLNDNSMLFVLRRRQCLIGEEEVAAAVEAAKRASSILSRV